MKPDRAFGFVYGGVGKREQKATGHTLLLTGSSDPSLYVKKCHPVIMWSWHSGMGMLSKKVMAGSKHGACMV